jgi:hypothetical protein
MEKQEKKIRMRNQMENGMYEKIFLVALQKRRNALIPNDVTGRIADA